MQYIGQLEKQDVDNGHGRGLRTWTRTTDVDTDKSGDSQVNARGRQQEQVDSRRLTLHSADFERDST